MLKALISAGASGAVARLTNFACVFISIPWIFESLGKIEYGVYAAALSIGTMVIVSDLGLGSALVTRVAKRRGGDFITRRYVSRAWWTVVSITSVVSGICIAIFLMAEEDASSSLSASTIALTIFSLIVGAPAAFYQRLAFAKNLHLYCNVTVIIGRLLSLLATYFCWKISIGIAGFLVAALVIPALVNSLSSIWLLLFKLRQLRPLSILTVGLVRVHQLKTGAVQLIVQGSSLLETGFDAFLIAFFLSVKYVAEYDVAVKLFLYFPVVVNMISMPLWPLLSASSSAQQKTNYRIAAYAGIAVFSIAIYAPMVFYHDWIIRRFIALQPELGIDFYLFLSIYCLFMSLGMIQTSYTQTAGIISAQAKLQLGSTFCCLMFKAIAIVLGSVPGLMLSLIFVCPIRFFLVESVLIRKTPRCRNLGP